MPSGAAVLQDLNWPEWKDTEAALAPYRDPDLLAHATPHQLAQLLTVFIRQDRFDEGGLLGVFKSGPILAIVRSAAKLLEAGETPSEI